MLARPTPIAPDAALPKAAVPTAAALVSVDVNVTPLSVSHDARPIREDASHRGYISASEAQVHAHRATRFAPERTHQPPVVLVDTTLRGVRVQIRRSVTGALEATTELGGEQAAWTVRSDSAATVRDLVALARGLAAVGEDGRRGQLSTYQSVRS